MKELYEKLVTMFETQRARVRAEIKAGLQTHEAQDVASRLCRGLDDIEVELRRGLVTKKD